MRRILAARLVKTLFVSLTVAVMAGCGGTELGSVWRGEEVVVDGVPSEWQGATTWIEDSNAAIGIMNDEEYLYIYLSSPDRSVAAQVVGSGFTVWLDSEGNKEETFGIRCPVGSSIPGGNPRQMAEAAENQDRFEEMVVERLKASVATLEILGPGKGERLSVTAGDANGIEIALGHENGRLVYELKVPLYTSGEHPYAIGGSREGKIGLGFETPEIDREAMIAASGGQGSPGGKTGGGGGGRGGGGRGGGGRGGGGRGSGGAPPGAEMPERVEIWTKVLLASAGGEVSE